MQKEIEELKLKLDAKEEFKPHQISNSLWNCEAFNKKIHEKYQKFVSNCDRSR